MKWSFMKPGDGKPHYLVCNADESEPGTFKDREIMRWTPHALIEGCAIGSYAIGAETCYIYIRGEFTEPLERMEAALKEARAAGIIGKNAMGTGKTINIWVHKGAGAYICGEETAMMNSIEGRRGNPRIKPPFPAVTGVFGQPTTINNVETLTAMPPILAQPSPWDKKHGHQPVRRLLQLQPPWDLGRADGVSLQGLPVRAVWRTDAWMPMRGDHPRWHLGADPDGRGSRSLAHGLRGFRRPGHDARLRR